MIYIPKHNKFRLDYTFFAPIPPSSPHKCTQFLHKCGHAVILMLTES